MENQRQTNPCSCPDKLGIKGTIFSSPDQDLWPLIQSLSPANTAMVAVGLGDLTCTRSRGLRLQVGDWSHLTDMAALLGGINPALSGDLPYSRQHHASVLQTYGNRNPMDGIETIWIHGWGIRAILEWHCLGMSAWADKEESTAFHHFQNNLMIRFLRQIFRASIKGVNVWLSFPLRQPADPDSVRNRPVPDLEDEVFHELLCASDLVVSVANVWKNGTLQTALVTTPHNSWIYPAKASSAFGLKPLEEPDLTALTRKIMNSVHEYTALNH